MKEFTGISFAAIRKLLDQLFQKKYVERGGYGAQNEAYDGNGEEIGTEYARLQRVVLD